MNEELERKRIGGKRTILIVDDEMVNRFMLGNIFEGLYEILYAEDGGQAMDIIREQGSSISLVLLDLVMPVMTGMEVLHAMRADKTLQGIPVIVFTSDQKAEVECLKLGAMDFVSKPYPIADVILARAARTIELSEDRTLIDETERDQLTGLYNREFFYRYADQIDKTNQGTQMDAVVVDIHRFHIINERYGKGYADDVLRELAGKLEKEAQKLNGIVGRLAADTFLAYWPHVESYQEVFDALSFDNAGSEETHVHLRMGVYEKADMDLDIERRFDRARSASNTVRGMLTTAIGVYNQEMHEKEIYAEQLVEEFPGAIREGQFIINFQPKFDIQQRVPVLAGAEALVRWIHPKQGMINPGVFIPLFEENGLILEMDRYVWRATAAQIHDWKKRLGFSVRVSVNVSRIDMYDPQLINTFKSLLEEYELDAGDLVLEITESAYTNDSGQIIETVNELRSLGFMVEMDDFGTGYSSLNMIHRLPIDALKLDMQFVRDAFRDGRDTRLIEVIIEIADYLHVPVIAEGVETHEQMLALKAMGCKLVQGYYFSRPVPAASFEKFLVERIEHDNKEAIRILMQSSQGKEAGTKNKGEVNITTIKKQFLPMLKWLSDQIPGGFFVYRADESQEIILANKTMLHLFGCQTMEEFKRLTGNTFNGIVHPDDLEATQSSILRQIAASGAENMDHVEYRIIAKDGSVHWLDDYGHLVNLEELGGVYFVFVSDITEKHKDRETTRRSNNMYTTLSNQIDDERNEFLSIARVNLTATVVSAITGTELYESDYVGSSFESFMESRVYSFIFDDERKRFAQIFNLENLLRNYEKGENPPRMVGYCHRQSGRQCFVLFRGNLASNPADGSITLFLEERVYDKEHVGMVLETSVLPIRYSMVAYVWRDHLHAIYGYDKDVSYSSYIGQSLSLLPEEQKQATAEALSMRTIAAKLTSSNEYIVETIDKRLAFYKDNLERELFLLLVAEK